MQNLMNCEVPAVNLHEGDTFCKRFRDTVRRYPDKTAVICKGQSLTYRELDQWSGHLANHLIANGIKREDIIGIATGRSIYTLVAMIGIWKAGAAYFYMNSTFPPSQIESLLLQCRCPCVIDEAYMDGIDRFVQLRHDIDFSAPESLALLIFTSGSTAKPKGVMIEHRNVMAMNANLSDFRLSPEDTFCLFPSFSFVASVSDTFPPLLAGSTLCIIEEGLRHDITKILQYFIDYKITVCFLPPVMAEKLSKVEQGKTQLRLLMVGSDKLHNLAHQRYEIRHVYGASEMCSLIADYVIKEPQSAYPVGKIKPGMRFYIIGKDGIPVKDGQEGELWLSGPQVTRGYLHDPKKTSEQYGLNPFTNDAGYERIYKTSDIVRKLDDGNLMYISRKDYMYKIRGYRVEAAAVESVILQYPGVKNIVVKAFPDSRGVSVLCGYFLSEQKLDPKLIKAFMRGQLPYYMVPSCLIQMDEFPCNLNGKINRAGFVPPNELDDYKLLEELY